MKSYIQYLYREYSNLPENTRGNIDDLRGHETLQSIPSSRVLESFRRRSPEEIPTNRLIQALRKGALNLRFRSINISQDKNMTCCLPYKQ